MRIRFNIYDPDSIDYAIARLNEYKKTIRYKAEEIVERLSEIGTQVAEFYYSQSGEEYEISCVVNGNSAMIIAEGDNVVFIEFGTGAYTQDFSQELDTEGLPPIFGGSWSATEGSGVYARHGFWHYKGTLYFGTDPTHGFYFASKEMKEQAVEIAKKVFAK